LKCFCFKMPVVPVFIEPLNCQAFMHLVMYCLGLH
jgi:hypothetical protein